MSINGETVGWFLASSATVIFAVTMLFTISDLNKKNKRREEILKKIKKQNMQMSFDFEDTSHTF